MFADTHHGVRPIHHGLLAGWGWGLMSMLLAVATLTNPVQGDPLRVGVATMEITPPIPYRMCGSFSQRVSTGIKDPLMAKAVVFQQGDVRLALVFCDLAHVSLDVSTRARKQASQRTGIPFDNMAIAATHSHTGPLYWGALRNHFHEQTMQNHGSDIYEKINYPNNLVRKLVQVIEQGAASLESVQLSAGTAREKRLSFNRRFHMTDGTVRFNPGLLNPRIVRPAGPIDPEVGIVAFLRGDKVWGSIVSFALHLDTVGGTEYSADFPKIAEDYLRQFHGPDFSLLFGAGTCGDINHIDVKTQSVRSTKEIGTMLGATIGKQISQLTKIRDVTLAVRSARVHVPMKTYSKEQITRAREDLGRRLPMLERVEAYNTLAVDLRQGSTLPIEVQVFRLSREVAVVMLPGEVFVDLGMAIKRKSPFKTTLVIELSNDGPGYIPTQKAFAEGSYETVNSRIQPGGGEVIVQTAVDLMNQLAAARPE